MPGPAAFCPAPHTRFSECCFPSLMAYFFRLWSSPRTSWKNGAAHSKNSGQPVSPGDLSPGGGEQTRCPFKIPAQDPSFPTRWQAEATPLAPAQLLWSVCICPTKMALPVPRSERRSPEAPARHSARPLTQHWVHRKLLSEGLLSSLGACGCIPEVQAKKHHACGLARRAPSV